MNDKFISCDWGTSTFRLRLIDVATLNVLAETTAEQGIAGTYSLWESQQTKDRISFYMAFLQEQISLLQQRITESLDGLLVIISGMASASIGLLELPYKQIPVQAADADFNTHLFPSTAFFPHPIVLVSGLQCDNDVMRGEETMMAGCDVESVAAAQLFIFPGTHSKHVVIQNGQLVSFNTFMTGEVFDLLSTKSILAASVIAGELENDATEMFAKGVKDSGQKNLLNSIFKVRTNQLFGTMDKTANYHYLSGLLIGAELKNVKSSDFKTVTVVSSGSLSVLYLKALEVLDCKAAIKQTDGAKALIKGQAIVFQQYLYNQQLNQPS